MIVSSTYVQNDNPYSDSIVGTDGMGHSSSSLPEELIDEKKVLHTAVKIFVMFQKIFARKQTNWGLQPPSYACRLR